MDDLELIELHARTLYTRDDAGRLIAVNEPGGKPAPRYFLGWTARGAIGRPRRDLPGALVERLGALVAAEPPSDDLERSPACLPALRALLGATGEAELGGPAYCFPDVIEARPGAVVAVTGDNAEVLRRWLPQWLPDLATGLPVMAVVVDGDAVAVCACARLPGAASEAGVETHPGFRGRGYAVTAVAAWARAMRARGVVPLYSTGWRNHASRRVAAKLGLVRYGASLGIG